MPKNSDQPGFRTSTGALTKKAEQRRKEPFVLDLGEDGKVTWPDPMQMRPRAAEKFLIDMFTTSVIEGLTSWLEGEDLKRFEKALDDDKHFPDYASLVQLQVDLQEHYESVFGRTGEGNASRS